MVQINDGGPAFPLAYTETNEHGVQFPFTHPGMSMRDWFAGQMLNGFGSAFANMVADESVPIENMAKSADGMAVVAYAFADAMLMECGKGGRRG